MMALKKTLATVEAIRNAQNPSTNRKTDVQASVVAVRATAMRLRRPVASTARAISGLVRMRTHTGKPRMRPICYGLMPWAPSHAGQNGSWMPTTRKKAP